MFYKNLIRPSVFRLYRNDSEVAHEQALKLLEMVSRYKWLQQLIQRYTTVNTPQLAQTLWGIRFPNPVGLAAGFDKNGIALHGLAALGFGFIEMGGITRHSQEGNPRPRLFRLPQDHAIINRMGFNNEGADKVAQRLAATERKQGRLTIPLGINLGKSKITPLDQAEEDYGASLKLLYPFGDFFTVNVSSPNTPELRQLQEKSRLSQLLKKIMQQTEELSGSGQKKPLLVKVAPDLTWQQIDGVLEVCIDCGISGIIATNTTTNRTGLTKPTSETGGLSGRPLHARALEIVRYIHRRTEGKLPIIGVGGIDSPEAAHSMLEAGAKLVQVFTGLVYEGPLLPKRILRDLVRSR